MNHILFVFPLGKNVPTGGLKIVYDYSNRLISDNFDVTIAYAAYFDSTDKSLMRKIKAVGKYLYAVVFFKNTGYTWYKKDSRIREVFVWNLNYNNIPKADIYIATSVNSAPYVSSYPIDRNKKFYFIQDYEAFIVPDDSFIKWTYRLPLRKIVISKWLSNLVEREKETCIIIPNGFDSNKFKVIIPIEQKDKFLISMLYHINDRKDIGTGIKAIEMAHKKIPQLRLVLFGAYPEPENLPNWIKYCKMPSLEKHIEINNRAAIYVGCSKIEGWGLTVGEAMMCGQAVACTDNDGYKEMASDKVNALLSPVGDSGALAENIIRLVLDDNLRYELAKKGVETIKEFNIERSYALFRDSLTNRESS